MSRSEVAVIDYGMGNLLSVQRGLEQVGASVCITSDHERISLADRVVLPGVGAFPAAMQELDRRGLVPVIQGLAKRGTPLLGICLGMQILFDTGLEFRQTAGLGLIAGNVVPVPSQAQDGSQTKIPHIGWNELHPSGTARWQDVNLLVDIKPGDATYFVHSYMAVPKDEQVRMADCFYGGSRVAAVVGSGRTFGCQFHPEKSGEIGLRILRGFMSA